MEAGSKDKLVGTVLDHVYRVEACIARGGMSTVYRAYHQNLQRACALKVLDARLCSQPRAISRFKQEARLATRLQHPNLMRVLSFGISEHAIYIAAELLSGRTLKEVIEQDGKLDAVRTRHLFQQICSGVQALHESGIVHRDLKPGNIMVSSAPSGTTSMCEESIKIMDLGIAKDVSDTAHLGLTSTGELLGTVPYMSPEHIIGKKIDARSDVFSLGCILFEMLVGTPLNNYATPGEMLTLNSAQRVLDEEQLPLPLRNAIARAVCRDRDERYGSVQELADAVEAAFSGQMVLPPAVRAARTRSFARVCMVLAIVVPIALVLGIICDWKDTQRTLLSTRLKADMSMHLPFAQTERDFVEYASWLKNNDPTTTAPYEKLIDHARENYGKYSVEHAHALALANADDATCKIHITDELGYAARELMLRRKYQDAVDVLSTALPSLTAGKRKWLCEQTQIAAVLAETYLRMERYDDAKKVIDGILTHAYGNCVQEIQSSFRMMGEIARHNHDYAVAIADHHHASDCYFHNGQPDMGLMCLADEALDQQAAGNSKQGQQIFQQIMAYRQWADMSAGRSFPSAAQIVTKYACFLASEKPRLARKECEVALTILHNGDKSQFHGDDYCRLADCYTELSRAYKMIGAESEAMRMQELEAEALQKASTQLRAHR